MDGTDVLPQTLRPIGALVMRFRRDAPSLDLQNPDTRRDSIDLPEDVEMGAEPEQVQLQESHLELTACM